MIASGTIFHSRGGFSVVYCALLYNMGSRYTMKTVDFEVLRDVAIATSFGSEIAITGFV